MIGSRSVTRISPTQKLSRAQLQTPDVCAVNAGDHHSCVYPSSSWEGKVLGSLCPHFCYHTFKLLCAQSSWGAKHRQHEIRISCRTVQFGGREPPILGSKFPQILSGTPYNRNLAVLTAGLSWIC